MASTFDVLSARTAGTVSDPGVGLPAPHRPFYRTTQAALTRGSSSAKSSSPKRTVRVPPPATGP